MLGMSACRPHIKSANRHTRKGNTHGSAGETCRPQKGGGPVRKSEYISTLPMLVDTTDRRRTHCVRPTPLGWAAAREAIERFAEENKKRLDTRFTRAHPRARPPRPHTRSGKPRKKANHSFPSQKEMLGMPACRPHIKSANRHTK